MAMASFQGARTPVEFCLSPLFHYQYSSLHRSIAELAENAEARGEVRRAIQRMCLSWLNKGKPPGGRLMTATDTTPIRKAHSPTLKGRTYVAVPNNVIAGNKPLDIGYEASFLSTLNMPDKWALPVDARRVKVEQTASQTGLEQIADLLNHPDLGLQELLCINVVDAKYGNAAYLAPAWQYGNLVIVSRLRAQAKVWTKTMESYTGGAPRVYGEKYYLSRQSRMKPYKRHPKTHEPYEVFQPSVFEWPGGEDLELEGRTAKGRQVRIHLRKWTDMMIRSKKDHNMKDKPFDLLAVRVTDAHTGKEVFAREMWLAVSGRRKAEVTAQESYEAYRHRYDIEPYLRFSKQSLLLENYQTPDVEHFDNWLLCNQLAAWLLYTASDETTCRPRKWQKYLPQNKQAPLQRRLSIAQTRLAAQDLFLTFDPLPFKPPKSKKGRPRQKGETQIQRTLHPVVKKSRTKTKIKQKTEKLE